MPSPLYNGGRIKEAKEAIHHIHTIMGESPERDILGGAGGGGGGVVGMLDYCNLQCSNVTLVTNQIVLKHSSAW